MSIKKYKSFDVVVVGGGIVGSSIGYGLSKLGLKTAILDGDDSSFRASAGTFGLVWVQGKGGKLISYAKWALLASKFFKNLSDELKDFTGIDVNYVNDGGFKLLLDEKEVEERKKLLQNIKQIGGENVANYEILDEKQIKSEIPNLGKNVLGATFCKNDGDCDPLSLLKSYRVGFKKNNGEFISNCLVNKIESKNREIIINTTKGIISSGKLVLAAGIANKNLGALVGLDVPVEPIRGQVLASERIDPVLPVLTNTIRQTKEGYLLFGEIKEDVGISTEVTREGIKEVASKALKTFPLLSNLRIIRTWAAMRPMPKDTFSIYDRSPLNKEIYLVSVHSGISQSALHSSIVSSWISGKPKHELMRELSLKRFN